MAKINLDKHPSKLDLQTINENFRKIEEEFNIKVLYRRNPIGEPNEMINPLDMNGHRIYNLPFPIANNEPARISDVEDAIIDAIAEFSVPGPPGNPGPQGDSAYEVAVDNGFVGTEQEWLDSLIGPEGPQGPSVNSDWNSSSGLSEILNKPTLGTASSQNIDYFATASQGLLADSAVQPDDLATVASTGDYADLTNKPAIPTIPGIATPSSDGLMAAADKAKLNGIADGATLNSTDSQLRDRATHTGTQSMSTVSGLSVALDTKVDKITGYGLSQTNFTQAEKDKLSALESSRWRGQFVSLAALQAGVPSPQPGDYADVDAGPGQNIERYVWDESDSQWVKQSGEAAPLTASQVKSLYESNPDTNAFTDSEKSKLSGVATGATANSSDSTLLNRANHTGTQAIGTVSGLQSALDGKAPTSHTHSAAQVSGLATVATSGNYNDLDNKPSIPAAQVNADWNASSGLEQILNKPGNATTSSAGLMSGADKLKLDGVESGATSNATNAQLRDRATHTGTQSAATITGLSAVATTGDYNDLSNKPILESTGTATASSGWTGSGITVYKVGRRVSNLGIYNRSATNLAADHQFSTIPVGFRPLTNCKINLWFTYTGGQGPAIGEVTTTGVVRIKEDLLNVTSIEIISTWDV